MFDFLEDPRIPMGQVGEGFEPIGTWNKPRFTVGGKNLKFQIVESSVSDLKYPVRLAAFSTADPVLNVGTGATPSAQSYTQNFDLKNVIEPEEELHIYEVRMGLPANSGIRCWPYFNGRERGGLDKGDYKLPTMTGTNTRFLGGWTALDSSQPGPGLPGLRFRFLMTYGKYPTFSFANQGNDYDKLVLHMQIAKMRIREVSEEKFSEMERTGVRILTAYSEDSRALL